MCFFVHLFVCKLLALIFLSFLFLNTTLYMCIERSQFYAETQASFNVCCQSKLHEGRAHRIVFGCFYFYSDEMQLLLLHTTETRYQTIESGNESCCIKRATLWQQRFQVYSLFSCVCVWHLHWATFYLSTRINAIDNKWHRMQCLFLVVYINRPRYQKKTRIQSGKWIEMPI